MQWPTNRGWSGQWEWRVGQREKHFLLKMERGRKIIPNKKKRSKMELNCRRRWRQNGCEVLYLPAFGLVKSTLKSINKKLASISRNEIKMIILSDLVHVLVFLFAVFYFPLLYCLCFFCSNVSLKRMYACVTCKVLTDMFSCI